MEEIKRKEKDDDGDDDDDENTDRTMQTNDVTLDKSIYCDKSLDSCMNICGKERSDLMCGCPVIQMFTLHG